MWKRIKINDILLSKGYINPKLLACTVLLVTVIWYWQYVRALYSPPVVECIGNFSLYFTRVSCWPAFKKMNSVITIYFGCSKAVHPNTAKRSSFWHSYVLYPVANISLLLQGRPYISTTSSWHRWSGWCRKSAIGLTCTCARIQKDICSWSKPFKWSSISFLIIRSIFIKVTAQSVFSLNNSVPIYKNHSKYSCI